MRGLSRGAREIVLYRPWTRSASCPAEGLAIASPCACRGTMPLRNHSEGNLESMNIDADFAELKQRLKTIEDRSEEHTSELQSRRDLVCRLLLEKKKKNKTAKRITKPI